MCLLVLELVQEITLSKSKDSLVLERVVYRLEEWVLVVDNLFQIVGLTIMVVMEKEKYVDLLYSMHKELLLIILSKICYMEHGGSLCCQGSDYISKLNNSYYF